MSRASARLSSPSRRINRSPSMAMLDFYMEPYFGYARTPDRVCLCGALAGEIMALPPELRARVDRFFRAHQTWLTGDPQARRRARRIHTPRPGEQDGAADLRGAARRAAGEADHGRRGSIAGCRDGAETAALRRCLTRMSAGRIPTSANFNKFVPTSHSTAHFRAPGFAFTVWTLTRRLPLGILSFDSRTAADAPGAKSCGLGQSCRACSWRCVGPCCRAHHWHATA